MKKLYDGNTDLRTNCKCSFCHIKKEQKPFMYCVFMSQQEALHGMAHELTPKVLENDNRTTVWCSHIPHMLNSLSCNIWVHAKIPNANLQLDQNVAPLPGCLAIFRRFSTLTVFSYIRADRLYKYPHSDKECISIQTSDRSSICCPFFFSFSFFLNYLLSISPLHPCSILHNMQVS